MPTNSLLKDELDRMLANGEFDRITDVHVELIRLYGVYAVSKWMAMEIWCAFAGADAGDVYDMADFLTFESLMEDANAHE